MVTLLPALAGHLRPLDLLAQAPGVRLARAHSTGFWARVGNRIAPQPPQGVADHGRPAGDRLPGPVPARPLRALDRGHLHQGVRLDQGSAGAHRARPGRQLQHHPGGRQHRLHCPRCRTHSRAIDGLGEARPAQDLGSGRSYFESTINADISSPAAFDIVESSREAVHEVDGADALVGGGAAFYLDTKVASNRDSKVIIPIVLVVVFLILMGLLRAVAAPLILIGTVVLSFGAALGISALLFEYVFGFAGSDPGFPLFAFVFLVALGIDYNIFLMTRVREETQTFGTRRGSLIALSSTGGVITSAGLVLAATFLVLGSIPVVFLAEIGVAVALGVMLDTLDREVGAGHGHQPRPRRQDLVAEQARPWRHHRRPSRRQAGGGAGPLTDASTPPPALPWGAWGSRCPGSACCSGCGSSQVGDCASAAVGSPTRSSSGSRWPTAGTSAPTTPRRRLVLRVRVRPRRSRSADHHRVAAGAPHRRQPRLLEPRVR